MTKEIKSDTIEQKISKVDEIIAWFQSEDFALEQATVKLKDAAGLIADVEKDLSTLQNEINVIKESFK